MPTAASSVMVTVQVLNDLAARVDEARAARQRRAAGRSILRSAVVREALEVLIAPTFSSCNGVARIRPIRRRKQASDGAEQLYTDRSSPWRPPRGTGPLPTHRASWPL
jgi:hypothetical protein